VEKSRNGLPENKMQLLVVNIGKLKAGECDSFKSKLEADSELNL